MTSVSRTISRAADELSSRFHDAGEMLGDLKDGAQRGLERGAKTVKHHPFAAIAIGVAVGYLIARIAHRG